MLRILKCFFLIHIWLVGRTIWKRITYLFIFPNTIKAEEIRTVFLFALYQVVYAFRSFALVTIIESKMTGFFPILSLWAIPCLFINNITTQFLLIEKALFLFFQESYCCHLRGYEARPPVWVPDYFRFRWWWSSSSRCFLIAHPPSKSISEF